MAKRNSPFEREDTAVIRHAQNELEKTSERVDEVTQKAEELASETRRTTEILKKERSKPPATAKK